MRYPYERFLIFLVSRKVEDLNRALNSYGLPDVGSLWLSDCRSRIRDTAPHGIVRYLDSSDSELGARHGVLEWADDEGFRPLWEVQPEFGQASRPALETAFRIFINPYSRGVMGLLLLSRSSDTEIEDILRDRFDVDLTPDALDTYRQIFWDVRGMGRATWGRFVGTLTHRQERHYVSMGLSSPTADEVRDILGMETVLDIDEMVNRVARDAYYKWKTAQDSPNPEDGIKWAELLLKARNSINGGKGTRGGDGENAVMSGDFAGLFTVDVVAEKHPSLSDIKGHLSPSNDAKAARGE